MGGGVIILIIGAKIKVNLINNILIKLHRVKVNLYDIRFIFIVKYNLIEFRLNL